MRYLAALLVVATACGGSDGPTEPTPDSVAGAYSLQTVNGAPLPFTVRQTLDYRSEVVAGRMTLNADGTCSERADMRVTDRGTTTTETVSGTCTYTLAGAGVTLRYTDGTVATAALSGPTLTFVSDGLTLAYRR